MADITMCTGLRCPVKDNCYRYKAVANEYRQAYFINVPYDTVNNKCQMYWPMEFKKEQEKASAGT